MKWEVLSYKIEEEEPDACAVIQSALNVKNGSFMVAHEMQALSRLMTLTSASAFAERRLTGHGCQQVALKMRGAMPQFVDDKHLFDLLGFVTDMGSEESVFCWI